MLADFDEGARQLLGACAAGSISAKHGRGAFWKRLATAKNFYGSLPEMPDARLLFDAVKHLKPTILTGLPLGNGRRRRRSNGRPSISREFRSSPAWRATSTSICIAATCWSTTARTTAGAYEAAGVVFVHHRNAEDSLRQLAKIFPSVKAPESA